MQDSAESWPVKRSRRKECLPCLEICCSSIVCSIDNVLERTEAEERGAVARNLVSGCKEGSAVGSLLAELPTFASTRLNRISRGLNTSEKGLMVVSSVLLLSHKVGLSLDLVSTDPGELHGRRDSNHGPTSLAD